MVAEFIYFFSTLLASFMCQRTLRETMPMLSCGDRERLSAFFFFLLGNSPILLHASPFPFFHTNVCCWISDSQLLPSALLLHHTPMLFQQYSQEIAPKRKNENRKKKKKLFLVTCLPLCVLCPWALQCGTFQKEKKSPSLYQGIGHCCTPAIHNRSWKLGW